MIPVFKIKFGAKYLHSLRPDPDFRHLNHAVKACGSLERKHSDTVKAQRPASKIIGPTVAILFLKRISPRQKDTVGPNSSSEKSCAWRRSLGPSIYASQKTQSFRNAFRKRIIAIENLCRTTMKDPHVTR